MYFDIVVKRPTVLNNTCVYAVGITLVGLSLYKYRIKRDLERMDEKISDMDLLSDHDSVY